MAEAPNENGPEKRQPICGVLSLVAPLLGVPFAFGLGKSYQGDSWGWGGFFILVMFGLGALLVGLAAALIGLARAEKYGVLPRIGLLLNGGILFWLFAFRH